MAGQVFWGGHQPAPRFVAGVFASNRRRASDTRKTITKSGERHRSSSPRVRQRSVRWYPRRGPVGECDDGLCACGSLCCCIAVRSAKSGRSSAKLHRTLRIFAHGPGITRAKVDAGVLQLERTGAVYRHAKHHDRAPPAGAIALNWGGLLFLGHGGPHQDRDGHRGPPPSPCSTSVFCLRDHSLCCAPPV